MLKTLGQINGNDISNKCVFSSYLNESSDAAGLMFTCNEFHAEGPAAVKELSPNLERVRGMSTRRRDDDLRLAQRDTGTQQLLIYFGVRWFSALNTIRHRLNCIRSGTRSQRRRSRNSGVTWSDRLPP